MMNENINQFLFWLLMLILLNNKSWVLFPFKDIDQLSFFMNVSFFINNVIDIGSVFRKQKHAVFMT